jgi:hypothetical protein
MRRMNPLALLGLLVAVGSLLAAEAAVTIKKLDDDKRTIVVTAKGKDYKLTIAKDVKVFGSDGKALASDIKYPELKAGVEATINYQRDGGTNVLKEIRLGKGQEKRRKPNADPNASQEGKSHIGQKPLTEMTAEDRYKGEDGGLYGGGQNVPTPVLLAAAQAATAKIVPLDEKVQPAKDGKIGLISLSYSNATREFAYFKPVADAEPQKSPFVQIVDCSQSGQAMEKWADPQAKPWMVTHQRLASAQLSPQQVQVVWAKIATIQPTGDLPDHGKKLQRDTTVYLQNAHAHFPNLRIVYFSSRTYGGWTNTLLNPEPYTYENGFVIRWLIQAQMNGDPELNPDRAKGPVKAPLLLWGPYLWGDGITPRKSDGLVWERKDFVDDGTHVSESGKQKVCGMLLKHFKEDALCKTWYAKK